MELPDKLFLIRSRVGCRRRKKGTEMKNRLRVGIRKEDKKLGLLRVIYSTRS